MNWLKWHLTLGPATEWLCHIRLHLPSKNLYFGAKWCRRCGDTY